MECYKEGSDEAKVVNLSYSVKPPESDKDYVCTDHPEFKIISYLIEK